MSATYQIAIIGSGPAGLSAAARAAELDRAVGASHPRHILLEGFGEHAKTIQRYQKGKHVMDEPGYLDLRSDLAFAAGTREAILGEWLQGIDRTGLNIRYNAEVAAVSGTRGAFTLALKNGESVTAENVILAIGLEGQPRRLGVPGEVHPAVQ